MPVLVVEDLAIGRGFRTVVVRDLKRTQIVQYAGASGDFYPIHTDEVFATQVAKQPTVLAHGMLTMGLTGRAVTDFVGDATLVRFGGRFKAAVWPGDDLEVVGTVTAVSVTGGRSRVKLDVVTSNQHNASVFEGWAVAELVSAQA